MINEKGLCKLLKAAHKGGGYEIIPHIDEGGATIVIAAKTWALRCNTVRLPAKAAVQLVEDAGYLPVEAALIQKGTSNQMIMPEAAEEKARFFANADNTTAVARPLPVIFKERFQLYQDEDAAVYGYDTALLELVDLKTAHPSCRITEEQHFLLFKLGDACVVIAPYRLSREDAERVAQIAEIDWGGADDMPDPVVNISLFDPEQDVEPEVEE